MGQLIQLIRHKYLVDAIGFNKVKGKPFSVGELLDKILELTTKTTKLVPASAAN